jgi:hypothetical protein
VQDMLADIKQLRETAEDREEQLVKAREQI